MRDICVSRFLLPTRASSRPPDEPVEADKLEYAEAGERIASERYGYLAGISSAGPMKEPVEFLMDEDAQHLRAARSGDDEVFSVFLCA